MSCALTALLHAEMIGMKQVREIPLKPPLSMVPPPILPTTKAKPNKKSRLLVTTSEPIETEHLSLLLEKAMGMKINEYFYINFVGTKDCVVTLVKSLSDEGIFTFLHVCYQMGKVARLVHLYICLYT